MTHREKALLEIAKEIITINSDLRPALTGSLMLALRGIKKRREASDIDIICENLCEEHEGYPIMPSIWKVGNINGSKSDVDAIQFEHRVSGIKVDFMYSDEKIELVDEIPCGSIEAMINTKEHYSKHDASEESIKKHSEDIDFIYSNNNF